MPCSIDNCGEAPLIKGTSPSVAAGLSYPQSTKIFTPSGVEELQQSIINNTLLAGIGGPVVGSGMKGVVGLCKVGKEAGFNTFKKYVHNAHHNFGAKKKPAWQKHLQIGKQGNLKRLPFGTKYKYKHGDTSKADYIRGVKAGD